MLDILRPFRWSWLISGDSSRKNATWSLERDSPLEQGERNLQAENYAEAEKCLTLAVEEADARRHSVRRVQSRIDLAEAQRKLGKFGEAEFTVRSAMVV